MKPMAAGDVPDRYEKVSAMTGLVGSATLGFRLSASASPGAAIQERQSSCRECGIVSQRLARTQRPRGDRRNFTPANVQRQAPADNDFLGILG
jgi:hypothetical protein